MARNDNYQSGINQNRHIIGVSNTFLKDRPMLSHAEEDIKALLGKISSVVLLTYALEDMDAYAETLAAGFKRMGFSKAVSLHTACGDELAMLESAEAIFIGGGNTLRLVANLYDLKHPDGRRVDPRPDASRNRLVETIRKRAGEGMPVMGASAGWNVMFSDVRTTNDMHVAVQTLSDGTKVSCLDGLGLLPDHLSGNPHYLEKVVLSEKEYEDFLNSNLDPEVIRKLRTVLDHQGEARIERLERVLQIDKDRKILALREGAYLLVKGMTMTLKGATNAVLCEAGEAPRELDIGADLSYLL